MTRADPTVLDAVMAQIEDGRQERPGRLFVLGLCGAQGSGKSTLARALVAACESRGLRAAVLSIDDLYLTRDERQTLARTVHPLLATRGPPGTHDLLLGRTVMAALDAGEACPLPRFDKAADDRLPAGQWPLAPAACEVLVLEGWCVGARAQAADALREPVNELEAREDPEGIWRTYANAALAGDYQDFFARIDRLVLLAAPGFEVIQRWRLEQEQETVRQAGGKVPGMDGATVARFIQHYERLTRHIMAEMPARADLVVRLDAERRPLGIVSRTL